MKHKFKSALGHIKRQRVAKKPRLDEAIENIPRITNETVAEHREEVLSSARKYIYPLQHSIHRIVTISSWLFVVLIVSFFGYCLLALYRFHTTSTFMYRVTQVIPFPIAKAGSHFVSYESYLFELRHYMHYYQTQQKVDFNSEAGKQQLASFSKTALQTVIDEAYVKELASKYKVSVTNQELNDEIMLVRQENRLGNSDQVFSDVLKEFWGWSIDDFKRELKQQLLAQKLVSALDTGTHKRAESALAQLQAGADFATLAHQVSDDAATKAAGGAYGVPIDKSNRDLSPQIIKVLFTLSPGQTSSIINTGSTLEIVKVLSSSDGKVQAAHISFNFQNLETYLTPLRKQEKPFILVAL
ncbi:MAG TPA: peptidylprolyl isomerase [Candidatus Saccharimonadales bacterium]|nr:peptidylprolyl isomerase [Candidatus Saccharimonadales bacterium]